MISASPMRAHIAGRSVLLAAGLVGMALLSALLAAAPATANQEQAKAEQAKAEPNSEDPPSAGKSDEAKTDKPQPEDAKKPKQDEPKKDEPTKPQPKKQEKPKQAAKPHKPPVPEPPPWESAGVKLLRPEGLAGWQYGSRPIEGWSNEQGTLLGKANGTPLLSGFSLGDFRLAFQWSVDDKGTWSLELPAVGEGENLSIAFAEGNACGRLTLGENQLHGGAKTPTLSDERSEKPHAAELARADGKLTLMVDGKQLWQVDLNRRRRFGLGLAVAKGAARIGELRLVEPPGKPIFNGKDLSGWWTPGNLKAWKAESGQLVLDGRGGNYIRTDGEYGNYTLYLQFLAKKGANSGVGIRTPRNGWPSAEGMELQIWDAPAKVGVNKSVTMAVYGNMPPLARNDRSQQWNNLVIKADGPIITAWVNGQMVQHLNTAHHPELRHRHPKGWIGFQDHGSWIRFHDLRILEAPAGDGLAAWHEPPPIGGSALLADRLMNHHRLTIADGIGSRVVQKTVAADKPTEHVLAELQGPGAVVRVARSNDQGRLAFFFDGEDKPRLQCKPADLARSGPLFDENRRVALTCLPYEKSLKIVLRDAKSADYRIDAVAFPAEVPVPKANFPRGWLSAMDYRRGQHSWGVTRFEGPAPRKDSPRVTLGPGETKQLVDFDGAGIVQWFRLQVDQKQLNDNDLWLEITVDGESEPAVAAPARYSFPGLVGEGNWHNYVTMRRSGFLNRMAMPFGNGIRFALRNAGEEPITGVALNASVLRPAKPYRENPAGRMRLRGSFLPAGEKRNLLAQCEGAGRWVALVCRAADGKQPGIARLLVDDNQQPGWSVASLDGFIGASGDFRSALSGRAGELAWRWMLLAPVDFRKTLRLEADTERLGDRFALFYVEK